MLLAQHSLPCMPGILLLGLIPYGNISASSFSPQGCNNNSNKVCPICLSRVQCFERSWFANRRCLDVGCNEGLVTLALATRFGCRSMMGVDIDEHLVRKACM